MINPLAVGPDTGFRLSSKERKNILKGRGHARTGISQRDIRGSSDKKYCITAAQQPTGNSSLVYIGNLKSETSEMEVRKHLANLGISCVSDVFSLNGKSSRYSSFCVSLGNASEMEKVFQAESWPIGVVVRPFRPAHRRNGNNKPYRRYYDKKSPVTVSRYRSNRNQDRHWSNRYTVFTDTDYNQNHGSNDERHQYHDRTRFEDYSDYYNHSYRY
jgi:hypothetical protein